MLPATRFRGTGLVVVSDGLTHRPLQAAGRHQDEPLKKMLKSIFFPSVRLGSKWPNGPRPGGWGPGAAGCSSDFSGMRSFMRRILSCRHFILV